MSWPVTGLLSQDLEVEVELLISCEHSTLRVGKEFWLCTICLGNPGTSSLGHHGSLRQPLVLAGGLAWHLYVVPTLKMKALLSVLRKSIGIPSQPFHQHPPAGPRKRVTPEASETEDTPETILHPTL